MMVSSLVSGARVRLAAVMLATVLVSACSTTSDEEPIESPKYELSDFEPAGEGPKGEIDQIWDPFEPANRAVYRFNWFIDQLILLPLVELYELITPQFARTGVTNFFSNIGEIPTFANALVQGKFASAGTTLNRFVINSTIGFLGVVDQASKVDINKQNEDFGQTLGHYGVGNGPYLVLPILGPSNLRDTTGRVVDWAWYNELDPLGEAQFQRDHLWYAGLKVIDTRKNVSFRYFETGTPYEYDWVKELYTRYRDLEISK